MNWELLRHSLGLDTEDWCRDLDLSVIVNGMPDDFTQTYRGTFTDLAGTPRFTVFMN